jgi:hypothetical protein
MIRQLLILSVLTSFLILPACQNDGSGKVNVNSGLSAYKTELYGAPLIKFDTTAFNFGKVYEGEQVGGYFRYRNLGTKDLFVTSVTASCGCTLPSFSKDPVKPGEEGKIKFIFDTEGRAGLNYKSINVITNGSSKEIELIIIAEVIRK